MMVLMNNIFCVLNLLVTPSFPIKYANSAMALTSFCCTCLLLFVKEEYVRSARDIAATRGSSDSQMEEQN
jgi:hypothetical protein